MTAREIIHQEFGSSKNFMTPDNRRYGTIHKGPRYTVAFETSRGTGFDREPIYGLSLAIYDHETGETARPGTNHGAGCHHSLTSRTEQIAHLRAHWNYADPRETFTFHAERAHA